MQVTFCVPGEPKGKGRPRFTRNGRVYTPADTIRYERLVQLAYDEAVGDLIFASPVKVVIEAIHKPPKGKSKKVVADMLSGHILPTKKPDADNVAKIILDALNGVAWHDDTQVVEMAVSKHYGVEAEVWVTVEEITAQRC